MSSPGLTKKAIAEAMKELMTEKPLAKISVSDIVERCGLNRNSFYYHFKDKYDLVNWIFYTDIFSGHDRGFLITESRWTLLRYLCEMLYENKIFYTNALSVTGQNSFMEYFQEFLHTTVIDRDSASLLMVANPEYSDKDLEYREYFVNFLVDSISAAIFRWLREGTTVPPDKFVKLTKMAVSGVAYSFLEEEEHAD